MNGEDDNDWIISNGDEGDPDADYGGAGQDDCWVDSNDFVDSCQIH